MTVWPWHPHPAASSPDARSLARAAPHHLVELCASGRCAAAVVPLQRAIDWGDSPSRALMAFLLIDGREGVAEDQKRGLELVEEGARLGRHYCQRVMAWYYLNYYGYDDDDQDKYEKYEQLVELALVSSGRGSKYGQFTIGELCRHSDRFGERLGAELGLANETDLAQAVAFYRLAAVQGLDEAQCMLAYMYSFGFGIDRDYTEALRWYKLAAAQGHPHALYNVAECHKYGRGIAKNKAKAIRWCRGVLAAGHPYGDYCG
jgi:TPR repeat protein